MLEKLRKFSNSIFAKIFLFIIAIPFVFWGMGDLFSGGSQNTIATVDKEKISTQGFINFVNNNVNPGQKIDEKNLELMLSNFIGQHLIEQEEEKFNIILSNASLAKIIRNQDFFKENNTFSRTKYEKFLIKNKFNAVSFEDNLNKQESKKQLLDFIGGGLLPSNFIINKNYNNVNHKRSVEIINLNKIIEKKIIITDKKINDYFEVNKDNYKVTFKSIKYSELSPKNLIGKDEFNDLFFKKIDQIDNLVMDGKNLNEISLEFDLNNFEESYINKDGENKDLKTQNIFSKKMLSEIFKIENSGQVILIEDKDKYYLVEQNNLEEVQKDLSNENLKKSIIKIIKKNEKIKFISEFASKISSNNFLRQDFLNISKENNINIKEIAFKSLNDNGEYKKELVKQIYSYPEKNVGLIADTNLKDIFLVYTNKVENVSISKNSEEFKKYYNLSKLKITGDLYNTYDKYLKEKYKIKINYNTLNNIKNYF